MEEEGELAGITTRSPQINKLTNEHRMDVVIKVIDLVNLLCLASGDGVNEFMCTIDNICLFVVQLQGISCGGDGAD